MSAASPKPGQLGRRDRFDRDRPAREAAAQRERDALTRDRGGALTGDDDAPQRPGAQPLDDRRRAALRAGAAPRDGRRASTMPAPQRLVERRRRFVDLLEEVVRRVAAIDVARRDLGPCQLGVGDRQRRAVVATSRSTPRARRSTADDLALRRRARRARASSRRRGGGSDRTPRRRRTARSRRRTRPRRSRRTAPGRCPAGRAGAARASAATCAAIATEPSNAGDRRPERFDRVGARRDAGATRAPGSPWRRS